MATTTKQKTQPKKNVVRTSLILILIAAAIVIVTGGIAQENYSTTSYNDLAFDESLGLTSGESACAAQSPPEIATRSLSKSIAIEDISEPFFEQDIAIPHADPRIIKNGTINILVKDIHVAINDIEKTAYDFGGGIIHKNIRENDIRHRHATLTVKVPSDDFDRTTAHIRSLAEHVTHETASTQDVSAEFIDQESRLIQKKAHEQQILDEILPRALTVEDLITVENHLAGIRSDIERIEGRLQYLRVQTEFSTISLTLTEESSTLSDTHWRPSTVAVDASNTLIKRIQNIIDHGIHIAISGLPIFILSLIGLSLLYTLGKRIFTAVAARHSK